MNWNDLQLFLAIAEEGSFRQAAQRLNLGHATLSRRIEAFEVRLNVKVFNRKTTGLSLTDAGKEIISTITPARKILEDLEISLQGQDQAVEGHITLTLPEFLSNHLVLPALAQFQQAWPLISIEILTDYKVLDLQSREADIAIRSTNNPDEQLIGRHIGGMFQAAYASREYLKQIQDEPAAYRWIRPLVSSEFNLSLHEQYDNGLPIKSNLILFDINSQLIAAKQGQGIATLPCLLGDSTSELVQISPPYHRVDLWLLCHKDLRDNKRMQLFRNFLVKLFKDNLGLLAGKAGIDLKP